MKPRYIIPALFLVSLASRADEFATQASVTNGSDTTPVEQPAEVSPEETVETNSVADETLPIEGDQTPENQTPAEEPAAPPDEDVEEVPARPPRPRVDPGLRNFYLQDQNLGNTAGPRAVKVPTWEKAEKLWRSEVEVGATGYRGNTDSDLMLLRLKTERKKDQRTLRLEARSSLGRKDGERDRANGEAVAALRREWENGWYHTAEIRYFTDRIADVDYQVVSVLSPGYEFVRTDDEHLSVELGPAYIAEKKAGEAESFAAVRLAVMMDKLIDKRILIWESIEYLPAIEDASIYLLIAEVGVESILSEWLCLRTVLQTRYDSNPADDKEKQDVFLSASLVTTF